MNEPQESTGTLNSTPALELMASRQFNSWLAEQRVSLAFTTYQSGKLFLYRDAARRTAFGVRADV